MVSNNSTNSNEQNSFAELLKNLEKAKELLLKFFEAKIMQAEKWEQIHAEEIAYQAFLKALEETLQESRLDQIAEEELIQNVFVKALNDNGKEHFTETPDYYYDQAILDYGIARSMYDGKTGNTYEFEDLLAKKVDHLMKRATEGSLNEGQCHSLMEVCRQNQDKYNELSETQQAFIKVTHKCYEAYKQEYENAGRPPYPIDMSAERQELSKELNILARQGVRENIERSFEQEPSYDNQAEKPIDYSQLSSEQPLAAYPKSKEIRPEKPPRNLLSVDQAYLNQLDGSTIEHTGDVEFQCDVPDNTKIHVRNGDIRIKGNVGNNVQILANDQEAAKVFKSTAFNATIDQDKTLLKYKGENYDLGLNTISIEGAMGSGLRVESDYANMRAESVGDRANISIGVGNIDIKQSGKSTTISKNVGDINIDKAADQLTIEHNHFGAINIGKTGDDTRIEAQVANINIDNSGSNTNISGDAVMLDVGRIGSNSLIDIKRGNANIDQLNSDSRVYNDYGDINIQSTESNTNVYTAIGNIDIDSQHPTTTEYSKQKMLQQSYDQDQALQNRDGTQRY